MTPKGLTLQWVNNTWSNQCWLLFAKVIGEISLPLAKGEGAPYYVFTMNDYDKIWFHALQQLKEKSYDQFLEFTLWSGSHGT